MMTPCCVCQGHALAPHRHRILLRSNAAGAGLVFVTWQITGKGRKQTKRETRPEPGEDLVLTIDLPLQRTAINLLSEHRKAAAVIMDVETGEILVMASHPLFNVNDFERRISAKNIPSSMRRRIRSALFARASMGFYPPMPLRLKK